MEKKNLFKFDMKDFDLFTFHYSHFKVNLMFLKNAAAITVYRFPSCCTRHSVQTGSGPLSLSCNV
jgi:hypothetical protein